MIDDGEFVDRRLVEFEVGDRSGVGTPPAFENAATEDLLLIDPVELPVVDAILEAVSGKLDLFTGGDVERVKVVIADEGDAPAVGTERRFLLRAGLCRQPLESARCERIEVEIVVDREF
ncbi:MAG TPA: hypothetical protein VHL58_05160 [Thermoanaerobaculia bacterium]|nr:hypothetical protein [Thermoanaerobaculia bacterium]